MIVLVVALWGCTGPDAPAPRLLPVPAAMAVEPGALALPADAAVCAGPGAEAEAEQLAADLRAGTGGAWPLRVGAAPRRGDVALDLDPSLDPEAYTLDSAGRHVAIAAGDAAGLARAGQTLRQLLDLPILPGEPLPGPHRVPRVVIEDAPRFPWRGHMLDVARHFFPAEVVHRQIELVAAHKLNVLHLHLTDDQGWRLDIPGWPLLAELGGASEVGGGPGGFYEAETWAALQAHAAARHVTLVPEIDIPGHVQAAQVAYGALHPSGEPPPPYTSTGVGFSGLADHEESRRFVREVFTAVAAMSPGSPVHLGGDEAPGVDEALYDELVGLAVDTLTEAGADAIGWEEVGRAGPAGPPVAQAWRYEAHLDDAIAAGAAVIASPAAHAYLDMKYDLSTEPGHLWAGLVEVDQAYAWDPEDLSPGAAVIGVEAPLWTEYVRTADEIDLLTWPRLCGIAEIGWSPRDGRDWEGYRERLAAHGARLSSVDFYRSPLIDW